MFRGNVQQPSWTWVKVSILLGTLGLVLTVLGCDSGSESGEYGQGSESGYYAYAALGEGPEPSPDLTLFDTLHSHRDGAQLVLSYDFATNAFTGTVENTTKATLHGVKVEVHFSNGAKLGPTTPVDLAPGQVVDIALPTGWQPITFWSAYPEVD